jgi:hypothetical protein
MNFDENYFKILNYTNYLDREDRYINLAKELISYLRTNQLISEHDKFLDFGAAIGFLTNSLKKLKINCDAYDISEWARSEAKRRYDIDYIDYSEKKYDCLIALDVFEHMTDKNIEHCIRIFNPVKIIVRIPCSTNGGKSYHLNVSNIDPTHINCKNKDDWFNFFEKLGYQKKIKFNLYTIYDTVGVMCYLMIK